MSAVPTLLAATATAVSYVVVRSPRGSATDAQAARAVARPLGDGVDRVVAAATDLGSVYALAGASAVLGALGRRDVALDVLGAGMLAWGAAQGAKPLAGRERPYQADGSARLVAEPAGSSWPSGHVAVAAAVGTVAASRGGRGAALFGTALAGFVGFSRVYVGVHYPSDVLGGLGIGRLSADVWDVAVRAGRRRAGRRRRRALGHR